VHTPQHTHNIWQSYVPENLKLLKKASGGIEFHASEEVTKVYIPPSSKFHKK
jgi:hypothetical protein